MWNSTGIIFADRSIVGDEPHAIFVNTNNTIYATHRQKKQIVVWNEGSESPTKIISGNFTNPWSLFVTSNGDIYIDDGFENGRVQKWISTNETFAIVMNVNSSCYGLFVDIKDNLYCSMYYHHRVVKRSLNDPVMTTVVVAGTGSEGSASNELSFPGGIFVDVNLDLYVADCLNHRIQLFQPGESYGITVAGNESLSPTITLYCPMGISLDGLKYLFIADTFNYRIVGSGPNGFRCLVGCYKQGYQLHQWLQAFSFSFDRSGNIFVGGNNRIQKFIYVKKSCGKLKKI
jgi:hypothetical protein